ncbi:uncharacterized protein LOC144542464 [Centroberyx gerrardi]
MYEKEKDGEEESELRERKDQKEEDGVSSEEEEEEEELLCMEPAGSRYCLLSPCVCLRCPSAPPFEPDVYPACLAAAPDPDLDSGLLNLRQGGSSAGTEAPQRTEPEGLSDPSRPPELQREEGAGGPSLPRDRAPQLGQRAPTAGIYPRIYPRIYPSLSQWDFTGDRQTQAELSRKQETVTWEKDVQLTKNNMNSDLLHHLSVCISAVADQLQTNSSSDLRFILHSVFDHNTNKRQTEENDQERALSRLSVGSCSFCSASKLCRKTTKLCRSCGKVFCCSLPPFHQISV